MNRIFILFFCLISAVLLFTVVQANYSAYNPGSETEHYQSDIDLVLSQDALSIEENEDDRFESFDFLKNTDGLSGRINKRRFLVKHTISRCRQNPVLIFYTNLPPPLSV